MIKDEIKLQGKRTTSGSLIFKDHIDEQTIIERISPDKDVDGFHPVNVGRLSLGLPGLEPCTPRGCV